MKKILLICGLPRSGTTFVQNLISSCFEDILCWPDESHLLDSPDLMKNYVDFSMQYFEKYLLTNPLDGYSPYGTCAEYVSNSLLIWMALHGVLDIRENENGIEDRIVHSIQKFRSNTLSNINDASFILLKKPYSERNLSILSNYFQPHKIIVVYCLRDVKKVYNSAVMELKWFDNDFFINMASVSYENILNYKSQNDKCFVPFLFDKLYDDNYLQFFISKISEVIGCGYNHIKMHKSNVNMAPHLKKMSADIDLSADDVFLYPPFTELYDKYRHLYTTFDSIV